jgi:transcriptional regulator with XRE-family HTH domain
MPRAPKIENLRNPLRLLRGLLSEKGDKFPISQQSLSEITNISASTIRAIEGGQRNLTASISWQIALIIGADWDKKRRRWIYLLPDQQGRHLPFKYENFLEFHGIMSKRPPDYKREIENLLKQINQLFDDVSDDRYSALYFRFQDFVEKCKYDFRLKSNEPDALANLKSEIGVKRLYGP